MPDFDFYTTSPAKRQRISSEEFAGKYGAHPDDVAEVARRLRDYLRDHPDGRYAGTAQSYLHDTLTNCTVVSP